MDPWEHIRRAAADRRSGSAGVAARAAAGLAGLRTRRDVARAARALIRAHPAMAAVWRLLIDCWDAPDIAQAAGRFVVRHAAEADAAARAARWALSGRNNVVLTHSASSAVEAALEHVRARVTSVSCTVSLPGGEGRVLARRLTKNGFAAEVVPDAGIAHAAGRASVALVGADAVTEEAVVNKVGTRLIALAARDAGIGCYVIATSSKLLPSRVVAPPPEFEATPLGLFDAVITDRGALRPAAVRRAVARVRVPRALAGMRP